MEKKDILNMIRKTYPKIDFVNNFHIPKTLMHADLYYSSVNLVIFVLESCQELYSEDFSDDLVQSLGYFPCYFYLDETDPKEVASTLTDIEHYIQLGNDDITVENIKKNCEGFLEIEEFANKMGLQIINAGNKEDPFQIKLSDAKDVLNIESGSEKDERLMKLFYSQITDEFPDTEEENEIDLDSDNESLASDICESPKLDISDVTHTQPKIEREYVCFNLGEDYIIQSKDFLLTREAFSRLAIKANTPEGKYISKQFHMFLDMIKDLIKICERRKSQTVKLINSKKTKRLITHHHKKKYKKLQKKKQEDSIKYLKTIQELIEENKHLQEENKHLQNENKNIEDERRSSIAYA